MSTASEKITAVAFRGVQILALNSYGVPAASGTSEYAGVKIVGAKALTVNRPERQRIVATGDDRVLAQFLLPPQDGVSGELRTGALDMGAEEVMTGLTAKTVGEMKVLPAETDVTDLPDLLVLAWREAKSVAAGDEGRSHYEFILIPKAELSPMGGSFEESNAENRSYSVTATVVGKWPWGEDLVEGTDGCTEMQMAEGASEYVPRISAFQGDGTATEFSLGINAVSTDKMKVYTYDGSTGTLTDVTSTVTLAVGSITFSSAPADGLYIIAVTEVAG
jgi:hypothetical protein